MTITLSTDEVIAAICDYISKDSPFEAIGPELVSFHWVDSAGDEIKVQPFVRAAITRKAGVQAASTVGA